jgi:hypothetical protein
MATISRLSRSTMARGVCAGATMPIRLHINRGLLDGFRRFG